MAGFSENAFVKKLTELNNTSQSIQTLSLWLIHHRKHHATVVKIWLRELFKVKENKKLTFMYLANDVIQNSKKKGPEYGKEYGTVLKTAFEHMSEKTQEKTKSSLERLLKIWSERGVYDDVHIVNFKNALKSSEGPPKKKNKVEKIEDNDEPPPVSSPKERTNPEQVVVEVDGKSETHIYLSPHTPAADPPEPEELIKAIQELESTTASADEGVRQRIAQLPPEVSNISVLSKIEDRAAADKLSVQVDEALQLINDYNQRLSVEIENRNKVASMLKDFLISQRELLAQAEKSLEEYQEKLQRALTVKQELKAHIQNLPDLTQLPDVTGGLAPLPSAGDLFNIH